METQIQTHKLQNNTENQDQDQSTSKWQDLPQDISESILRRLCLADLLNFGLVCSSWKASLNSAIKTKQCHPNPHIPLLLLCPKWVFSRQDPYLVEVNSQRILHPKRRLYPRSQRVLGTVDGWLIMVKVTETCSLPFFFNPVSHERFNLPLITKDLSYIIIKKFVANSAPSDNNNRQGDSIFVVCLAENRIVYCKITDNSWSLIKTKRGSMDLLDIIVIGNLLYVLGHRTRLDCIEIYNLDDDNPIMARQKLVVLDPKPRVRQDNVLFRAYEDIYLAHDEVSGDLMLVVTRYDSGLSRFLFGNRAYFDSIKEFRVMKLDRNNDEAVRWVEIEDLGDCLVFFDLINCRLISTVGLQMENVSRNCVYFAEGTDIKVFCLSDKSFRSFHISESNCSLKRYWYHCFWFTPNL